MVETLRVGLPLVPGASRPARAGLDGGVATWRDGETGRRCAVGCYERALRGA